MSVPPERLAVIAHRGSAGRHPENTTGAFAEAVRLGADGVELDVRQSRDGHLVVHHDPVLPDGRVVSETERGALPAHVPLLEDALDACGRLLVNVEVKSHPGEAGFVAGETTARKAARLLADRARRRLGGLVVLSSFSVEALQAACEEVPDRQELALEIALLVSWSTPQADAGLDTVLANGWEALHPHFALLDERLAARAGETGTALRAWTVDDPGQVARLAGLQVDAVITNDVAMARATLGLG